MIKVVRCVSWVAVSSEEQAKDTLISLPKQREGNREFIASISTRYPGNFGVLIDELQMADSRRILTLEEAAKMYPAYARLKKMIETKSFDLLVAHKWDRIGRAESLVISIRDYCLDQGISVVVLEAIPSTIDAFRLRNDEGYRLSGIIGAWGAAREDREIERRTSEGRTHAARSGRIYLGKWPYGYRWLYDSDGNRQVVINQSEGEVVRRVFDIYVNGEISYVRIAELLTAEGIPSPRGSVWSDKGVLELIKRASFYAGTTTINRSGPQPEESFLGVHPPLITEETAKRAEQLFKSRKRGKPRSHAVPAACTCGYCGHSMVALSAKSKNDKVFRLSARCKACKLIVSELSIVEKLETVIQHIIDVGAEDLMAKDNVNEEKQRVLAEINDKQSLIERESKAIDELLDDLEAGLTTVERIRNRMNSKGASLKLLKADLEKLNEYMLDLENRSDPSLRVQEIKQLGFKMLDLRYEEPVIVREWLRSHFKIVLMEGIHISVV